MLRLWATFLSLSATSGFILPQRHGLLRDPSLGAASVARDPSNAQLAKLSAFFVDNFWAPQLEQGLSGSQRSGLVEIQAKDFLDRYGDLLGKRRLSSALLVDEQTRGVCGLELTLIAKDTRAIIPREQGELMLKSAISRFGPKERKLLKFFDIKDLVADVLPGNYDVVPVLSNLAVSPESRRCGVGLELCQAVEAQCVEWGFGELWLQVEEENSPARRLYEGKLGYDLEWKVNGALALRIDDADPAGSFRETVAPLLVLSKALNGGVRRKRAKTTFQSVPESTTDEVRVEEGGWLEAVDEATGNTYYYNPETNETSWGPPN